MARSADLYIGGIYQGQYESWETDKENKWINIYNMVDGRLIGVDTLKYKVTFDDWFFTVTCERRD
jgi:hypothetical protein